MKKGFLSASSPPNHPVTVAMKLLSTIFSRFFSSDDDPSRAEEIQKAARLKSALLENMSHEIRTPLTSIIGFAEAIGEEVETAERRMENPDLDTLRRFADRIEKSGRRLLGTLDKILNLSKLEADEASLSEEPVDLGTEAEKIADQFSAQATENNVDLQVEASETLARANTEAVQLALRNLVSNAIKYTPEGGRVQIRTWQINGTAGLEVEDTGIGMNPEQVPELFEAFRQASEGRNRSYEGTGLGLTVTQQAIEKMNGSIEVETEKSGGSRFVVRLPRWGADAAPAPEERHAPARKECGAPPLLAAPPSTNGHPPALRIATGLEQHLPDRWPVD